MHRKAWRISLPAERGNDHCRVGRPSNPGDKSGPLAAARQTGGFASAGRAAGARRIPSKPLWRRVHWPWPHTGRGCLAGSVRVAQECAVGRQQTRANRRAQCVRPNRPEVFPRQRSEGGNAAGRGRWTRVSIMGRGPDVWFDSEIKIARSYPGSTGERPGPGRAVSQTGSRVRQPAADPRRRQRPRAARA